MNFPTMEDINVILGMVKLALVIITTVVIPLIVALKRAKDNYKNAQTDADKQKAVVEMLDVVRQLIVVVEKTFTEVSGREKKNEVLSALERYATQNGYEFDREYWSEIVDGIVATTNNVNVNK